MPSSRIASLPSSLSASMSFCWRDSGDPIRTTASLFFCEKKKHCSWSLGPQASPSGQEQSQGSPRDLNFTFEASGSRCCLTANVSSRSIHHHQPFCFGLSRFHCEYPQFFLSLTQFIFNLLDLAIQDDNVSTFAIASWPPEVRFSFASTRWYPAVPCNSSPDFRAVTWRCILSPPRLRLACVSSTATFFRPRSSHAFSANVKMHIALSLCSARNAPVQLWQQENLHFASSISTDMLDLHLVGCAWRRI